MKKFNSSTGGYKIDFYYEGIYAGSTDWHKTLRDAKKRYLEIYKKKNIDPKKLKACFAEI